MINPTRKTRKRASNQFWPVSAHRQGATCRPWRKAWSILGEIVLGASLFTMLYLYALVLF